ncbi:MAG: hypothetical protein N2053_08000 [Chitinispirillaceae bacterium]|nr:hypothetical protein [Chitinispirillaceae bacterium]
MKKDNIKTHRKKSIITLFGIISIIIILSIIFFNNYDLFLSNKWIKIPEIFDSKKIFRVVKKLVTTGTENPNQEGAVEKDSTLHKDIIDSEFIKVENNYVDKRENTDKEEKSGKESSFQLYPIALQVRGFISNRKDIVLNLSLELFFEDIDMKKEILLKREEIKIMVMKELKEKELSEIKPDLLESQLPSSINSIFDKNVIRKVKIKTIDIEKVAER